MDTPSDESFQEVSRQIKDDILKKIDTMIDEKLAGARADINTLTADNEILINNQKKLRDSFKTDIRKIQADILMLKLQVKPQSAKRQKTGLMRL